MPEIRDRVTQSFDPEKDGPGAKTGSKASSRSATPATTKDITPTPEYVGRVSVSLIFFLKWAHHGFD